MPWLMVYLGISSIRSRKRPSGGFLLPTRRKGLGLMPNPMTSAKRFSGGAARAGDTDSAVRKVRQASEEHIIRN